MPLSELMDIEVMCLFVASEWGRHWQRVLETNIDLNQARQHKDVFRKARTQIFESVGCGLCEQRYESRLSVKNCHIVFQCAKCATVVGTVGSVSVLWTVAVDCG